MPDEYPLSFGFDDISIDTGPLRAMIDFDDMVGKDQLLGGRYRLRTELSRQGDTATWLACDDILSRSVLVHILLPGDPRTDAMLAAARASATATDSRFLRVLDALEAGPHEPVSFVVFEFSPSESLGSVLVDGPLGALSSAWLIRELADALSAMHAQGLFHRRVSPETVLITTSGNVKMMGFQIDAVLNPMPGEEELVFSELEDLDVQSLGRVLYACLTGLWPHDDAVVWGLPAAPRGPQGEICAPTQVRSGVSPVLDAVCMQILAPRSGSMPLRTARDIAHSLSRVLGNAEASDDLELRVHNVKNNRPAYLPKRGG